MTNKDDDTIREAAARTMHRYDMTTGEGITDPATVERVWSVAGNAYRDNADAVLAAVTPLIEARLIERLAEEADTKASLYGGGIDFLANNKAWKMVAGWLRAQPEMKK